MSIHTINLSKRYGSHLALESLSLEVNNGEVFGFLGPNGAGKTTSMRMMVGLMRPTSGQVRIDGIDIQQEPEKAKRRIGFVPDEPHLFDGLTGREFLDFIAEAHGLDPEPARARAAELVERFSLGEHLGQFIGGYSHGTRQKLALCGALLPEPSNLLLDEPTVGLDPRAAFTLKETLRQLAASGRTVLLSTHILEIAEGICDRVGIIDHGKLLAVGTVNELRSRSNLENASLEQLFLQLTDRVEGELLSAKP